MASQSEHSRMRNRGLLTKADREFFRGERESDREADIRYNINQRMEHIEEDLRILREAGEDELVAQFFDRFGRTRQLEERINELEEKLEQGEMPED